MEGDLQRTIGRNVRAHRERLGVSQEAFADQLDFHRTYLGGIERGERNLTLKSVERLAAIIDRDPLDLLSDADGVEGAPAPPEKRQPRRSSR